MRGVKKKRPYDSALRRRQAGETRMRILDAAEALFAGRGYVATTVEAIAGAAGVAPDTVYASFGSKAGVLHRLLDVRVGGDEAPVGVLERPGPQAVRAERARRRQLAAFATDITAILERVRPVDDILRGAAAVDPEVATLRERMEATRFQNMRRLASWVGANGAFRRGLDEEAAASIIWTLASPVVHGLLRRERGWSVERYRDWLADTLTRTLIG